MFHRKNPTVTNAQYGYYFPNPTVLVNWIITAVDQIGANEYYKEMI